MKLRKMPSTASRLQLDFKALTDRLIDFIRELPVEWRDRHSGGVAVIAPEYSWGALSAEQINDQLAIKRDYDEWFEIVCSVFRTATNDLNQRIKEADQSLCSWIELSSNWSLCRDPVSNERNLRDSAERFVKILEVLEVGGASEIILIPDTNTIIGQPDPTPYEAIAGNPKFLFLLLPTVLAELDELKNHHRNPDFRKKVNKVIARVKGWRIQGSLRDGVTVSGTITVKAVASDPDMQRTLKWLTNDNRDDRIIASVLEVQSNYPTARVLLVTGDINLLNKADIARIEVCESPKLRTPSGTNGD